MVSMPQYLLFCDAFLATGAGDQAGPTENRVGDGRWHFVLERLDEPERFEAVDSERDIHRDRLALLAVVRGLEAIEHCGLVRLITTSRYVDRGLRYGLPTWRDTAYQWESFGRLAPIRNADLWKRINAAMQFHDITSRLMQQNFMSIENRRSHVAWRADRASRIDRGRKVVPSRSGIVGTMRYCRADRQQVRSDNRASLLEKGRIFKNGHSSMALGYASEHLHSPQPGPKEDLTDCRIGRENLVRTGAGRLSNSAPEAQRIQWWEMAAQWVHSASSVPHDRVSLMGV